MNLPQSLKIRSITAIFFVIITIGLITISQWGLIIFLSIVAFCCQYEWGSMIWKKQNAWLRITLSIVSAISVIVITYFGLNTFFYVTLGLMFLLLMLTIWNHLLIKEVFFIISGGLVYIIIPLSLAYYVGQDQNAYDYRLILFPLFLIWANDVFAYLVGSLIGKTKMIPRISPNKTWEGTIGGILICCLLSICLGSLVLDHSFITSAAFGVGVGIISTLGDLFESALKREFGIKDSGSWLPGHGGFLDRFDSFLFVMPYAWLFWQILN